MKLMINKVEVPKCRCRKRKGEHWSGDDLLRVLGRNPLDADVIEIKDDGK